MSKTPDIISKKGLKVIFVSDKKKSGGGAQCRVECLDDSSKYDNKCDRDCTASNFEAMTCPFALVASAVCAAVAAE